MNYQGISTQTLEASLEVYYARLGSWNTTEDKREKYLVRIDEITSEIVKRETKNIKKGN